MYIIQNRGIMQCTPHELFNENFGLFRQVLCICSGRCMPYCGFDNHGWFPSWRCTGMLCGVQAPFFVVWYHCSLVTQYDLKQKKGLSLNSLYMLYTFWGYMLRLKRNSFFHFFHPFSHKHDKSATRMCNPSPITVWMGSFTILSNSCIHHCL